MQKHKSLKERAQFLCHLASESKQKIIKESHKKAYLSQIEQKLIYLSKVQQIKTVDELISAEIQMIELNKHNQTLDQGQIYNIAFIKLYCSLIFKCWETHQNTKGRIYLQKLLRAISSKMHLKVALINLLKIESLLSLKNYDIRSNEQYKYNQKTQVLFFYNLAKVHKLSKNQDFDLTFQKCKQLSERLSTQSIRDGLFGYIQRDVVNQILVDKFLEQIIESLLRKQEQLIEIESNQNQQIRMRFQNQIDIVKQYLESFFKIDVTKTQEAEIKIRGYENPNQVYCGLVLLKILNQKNIDAIRHIRNTRIFKNIIKSDRFHRTLSNKLKVFDNKLNHKFKIANREEYLQSIQKKNLHKFKTCEIGLYFDKFNFGNGKRVKRFVLANEKTIKWSNDEDNIQSCSKCEWKDVKNLFFGKVTVNFQKKQMNQINSWKCFSIALEDKTFDLICIEDEDDVFEWVNGFSYAINNAWAVKRKELIQKKLQAQSKFKSSTKDLLKMEKQIQRYNKKIFFSNGKILWSRLFMKIHSLQKSTKTNIFESKIEGITKLKRNKA